MARDKQPEDLDALLAEVEQSLAAPGTSPARRAPAAVTPAGASTARASHHNSGDSGKPAEAGLVARATRRLLVSLVAGGVCAALVFVLFFFTPFTGAISGAMGAAIAGFLTALLLPRRL